MSEAEDVDQEAPPPGMMDKIFVGVVPSGSIISRFSGERMKRVERHSEDDDVDLFDIRGTAGVF